MTWKLIALVVSATLVAAAAANASPLYFQGFETDTSGWVPDITSGDGNGSITRTLSGGGTLGLTAFDGSYYGEVHNDTNGYLSGYGDGGATNLSGNGVTPPPYPGSSFSQSISVYINTSLSAPNSAISAYWIDMSPSSITSDGVGCYPAACSDEHNFRLFYNGTDAAVTIDGALTAALTITSSGWYTFQDTYAQGATPTSLVDTDMNIFNASGTLLSSTPVLGDSDGGTLLSDNLAGPGYIWLTAWQDGFSNNLLGIDDVRADASAVPEPPTALLFLDSLVGLGAVGRARRTSAAERRRAAALTAT